MSSQEYFFYLTPSALPYKQDFVKYVMDPRGWTGNGFKFSITEEVQKANVHVYFKTNTQLKQLFHHISYFETELQGLSITDSSDEDNIKIYFNANNWNSPPTVFTVYDEKQRIVPRTERLQMYRAYLVQHEVGHAIGYDHPEQVEYAKKIYPCHPMQQQTKGTSMCKANPWISDFCG